MDKNLREKQIYDFIVDYVNINGFAPSIREVCKGLSIASTSTVQGYIKTLSDKGLINRQSHKKRAIMPKSDNKNVVSAPLVGSIVAGEPVISFENIENYLPLPEFYKKYGDLFVLKVHGDSMVGAGILENDYIVVKQQPTAENGDIVVAIIDGAATVKTYYKEENRIRLQPQNDNYKPIFTKDVTIAGKVVGLHRNID